MIKSELLRPDISDSKRLLEMKRYMVVNHPTFCCPISGEILDYRRCHIIKFTVNGKEKTDIVSHNGLNSMPGQKRALLQLRIIENWQDI